MPMQAQWQRLRLSVALILSTALLMPMSSLLRYQTHRTDKNALELPTVLYDAVAETFQIQDASKKCSIFLG